MILRPVVVIRDLHLMFFIPFCFSGLSRRFFNRKILGPLLEILFTIWQHFVLVG